ncbi:MAG TPA: hypothetical protein DCZ43_04555 [candidate division Zixibacteria bacterium]|nr:hypothetical protein [candidate division Zixibacteria bacterium]
MKSANFAITIIRASLATLFLITGCRATDLTTVRVASGLNQPTYVTSSPVNPKVLYILEQTSGLIKIQRDGTVLPRPFLNIHDRVGNTGGERGLLGLAFHPDYANNGYFFIDYTNYSGNTKISRFQVTSEPDSSDPNSEFVVLTIAQPYPNHNGGMLAFGPNDGYLYIGMGDGGSGGDPENRAQNDNELLGKILRIDINNGQPYAIPLSNPFVGIPGKRPEIWAKGVRNPWRFSFDNLNGNLYIGDVGQNLWEEIDFQSASSPGGENYGWRRMEGLHCYNPPANCDPGGLIYPIYEYSHDLGCSITGGYVYRGGILPTLAGTYFFADYCSARIWSFSFDGSNIVDFTERTTELAPGSGQSINNISSFGRDGYGEIYIIDYSDGEIYKIIPRHPGSMRGNIAAPSGQGIPDAIITVEHTGLDDTTDSEGQFFIGGLGDGTFNAQVTFPDFRDTILTGIVIAENETTNVNLTLSSITDTPIPSAFELFQNYPNPFNISTNIDYELAQQCNVKIDIYDISGGQFATLINEIEQVGHHRVIWNASDVSSGIYFYRMKAGTFDAVKKLALVK